MVLLVCLAVASAQYVYNGYYPSVGYGYGHVAHVPAYGYSYGSYGYPAAYVLKK